MQSSCGEAGAERTYAQTYMPLLNIQGYLRQPRLYNKLEETFFLDGLI